MTATIYIPADVHLITITVESSRIVTRTIRVGRGTQQRRERIQSTQQFPSGQTRQSITQLMTRANQIWAPANISFTLQGLTSHSIQAPGNREEVDEAGFVFLAGQYPAARNRISALFVYRFAGNEGGQAIENQRVCVVKSSPMQLMGRILAHEFGHLLSVPHMTSARSNLQNVMRPGLVAGDQIIQDQIDIARGSRLAQGASRPSSSPRPS